MTKKIERSRVEAGKAELPRKAAFLTTEKVDYLVVFDREGVLSVEVPVAILSKFVKTKAELKELKGAQKQSGAAAAAALATEKEAHLTTQAALAKAERRIKALEKKLDSGAEKPAAPAVPAPKPAAPAAKNAPVKAAAKKAPVVQAADKSNGLASAPAPATAPTPAAG